MTDSPNEKKFMREKIVKPHLSKRKIAVRILCCFVVAVLFGAVAAVSFVISLPIAEKHFGSEPETTAIPITIDRDDEPGNTHEAQEEPETQETVPETTPEETQAEESALELEEIIRMELEKVPWTVEKVEEYNRVLQDIAAEADDSIVTVASVKNETDWFDNPVENTGQYAGIVTAVNKNEVVILTAAKAVENADSLRILFNNGTMVSGSLKQKDSLTGLAAVSVAFSALDAELKEEIKPISLGNSYTVHTGDMMIAVGSPAGAVHSVKRGIVSYVARNVQGTDSQTRILFVDTKCDTGDGTFFLNLSGQLIGLAAKSDNQETGGDGTAVMPVSEYKGCLQKLSNGIPIPYLGIRGQDVSEAMQENGIPAGIYVTESIPDGPAYIAGIQNGDILTKLGAANIKTFREFQSHLETLKAGDQITVTVQRKGIDEFKEIEYNVNIGAR